MSSQYIKLERQGHSAIITVDFPPSNALAPPVRDGLGRAVGEMAADDEVWTLIISAAGDKFFMAGADIRALTDLSSEQALTRARAARELFDFIADLPKPVIAAINGYCLGGGLELALACDIRVAAEHAQLGLPEVGLGLMPGGGGTQRLPLVVGQGLARYLIFTGQRLSAAEAMSVGLVQKVVPLDQLKEEALGLAERINRQGPLGVRAAKKALNAAAALPLAQGLDTENHLWAGLFATDDLREGVRAFLDKRKPEFNAS